MEFIIIILLIVWLYGLLFDYVFDEIPPRIKRVVHTDNGFKIQSKWLFSPFWFDCGIGDILGSEFKIIYYKTYDEALKKIKEY